MKKIEEKSLHIYRNFTKILIFIKSTILFRTQLESD